MKQTVKTRFAAFLALLVGAGLGLPPATPAREEVALLFTAGLPQTEFAAREIGRALEAVGDTAVRRSLDALPRTTNRVCLVLAASRPASKRMCRWRANGSLRSAAGVHDE